MWPRIVCRAILKSKGRSLRFGEQSTERRGLIAVLRPYWPPSRVPVEDHAGPISSSTTAMMRSAAAWCSKWPKPGSTSTLASGTAAASCIAW